jgi:uncharacterized phage-associated protein
MASVDDVVAYVLSKTGEVTALKLQKLLYYSQAWSLVWNEGTPLFSDRIEAWANGPVVRSVYAGHRLQMHVSTWPSGHSDRVSDVERENIDIVLGFYGKKPGHELSELTHREDPWRHARGSLPLGARSEAEITLAAMHEYYDGLVDTTE